MYTFRTADNAKWGAGKGNPLSSTEGDENLWGLLERLDALEATPREGVGIDDITQTDGSFTIELTNGAHKGPFTLPAAKFTVRDWAPNALLTYNTFVREGGSSYLVLKNHTSATSFDPNATDGGGNDLYGELPFPSQPILTFLDGGFPPLFAIEYGNIFSVPDVGVFLVLRDHTTAATFDPEAMNGSNQPLYLRIFAPVETEIANIQFQFAGTPPSDGSTIMVYIQDDDRDLILDENLPNSFAHLEVACTNEIAWTLTYDGNTVATITFEPGALLDGDTGQFGTIAGNGAAIPNASLLRLVSPTSADLTAKFLTLALRGRYVPAP